MHSKIAGHPVPIPITSTDVYAQIGYVMLIGLAAKNAILIVEFANQMRGQGRDPIDGRNASGRHALAPDPDDFHSLHPGHLPLAFSHGDGAQSRISLGTAVLGGMLVSLVMNLAIVPVLYVVVIELTERKRRAAQPAKGP